MLSEKIVEALNRQIQVEATSSQHYLAMAIWAETTGFNGAAKFLYAHSDEERFHMLKLVKFLNERGGKATVGSMPEPKAKFNDLRNIFEDLLEHETQVTSEINGLVDLCLSLKDYTTYNFLQWYVSEQIEEEALARNIMDKLNLIGNDKGGMYLFDKEMETLATAAKV